MNASDACVDIASLTGADYHRVTQETGPLEGR